MKWGIGLAITGLLVAMTVGCVGGNDLPLVQVSGRVTFDGKSCPKSGTILFVQVSGTGKPGLPTRPARAAFGVDGRFEATSFQKGDGLLPGTYQVSISCLEGEPGPSRPKEKISYVPADYRPPDLVVEEGQDPITVNYDVPFQKPSIL